MKLMKLHYPYRIELHGEGELVTSQLPEPENIIEVDGTIHLYLGNESIETTDESQKMEQIQIMKRIRMMNRISSCINLLYKSL